ncbi:Rho GTPase activation protein (RhoGAP) with PH domain [Klebsormidium nitens]|uniref:Rho GTPase activation protein (RhoGAP) with PH domain n=1 Tax=Klebsormidium nitens TaxID=105231 RepID=A0A1Y1I5H1_KLENI|nr:Rho GTPase activation protein (RhoGAP) with PH domain [Klebsormidium nitens]|eukprot:GAQ85733.1 Rho GTPase activation protein (RhoGAP) with PH domain [Klebsormidium nitens]
MNGMSGSLGQGAFHASYDVRPPGKKQLGILKAGNLYISGRGMGWKSWKKRWFILTKTPTRTALVYFRGEPNGPINPSDALDGINLVNTGRVLAKLDKKMIILMFPDNRSYTFKAESLDELDGWRQMLEKALVDAPNPEPEGEPESSYKSDTMDSSRDFSGEYKSPPQKKRPQKSLVIGRPILLALEDIDGSPSFLEKALQFIETTGVNVEGILRHSADVELVEKRVQAYEQGANEFRPDEDAHVIGDCIKHVLRELPSSPVPDLCCAALIRAYRKPNRNVQIEEMRIAVADSFPEPNRRLLQRVLRMMLTVASNSSVNLMNADAVARCMAPLLLRPIFSGDVPIFVDDGGAGPTSEEEHAMLQAMNAANVGGALIRAMMKEFDNLFVEDEHLTSATISRSFSDDMYRDTSRVSYQTSIPSHLSRDSDASSSGIALDGVNGAHVLTSLDEPTVRHDLSGTTLAREGEGDHSDAQRGYSDGRKGYADAPRGYSDAPRVYPEAPRGYSDARNEPDVRELTEDEELAAIERLTQQRDVLEVAVWKKKEENAGLKEALRLRKQSLQDRRYDLEQEVRRLNGALVHEADQNALMEIAMGAASAMLEHSKDLDPEAQMQLQEIVALEKDVTRLRTQIDDLQIDMLNRRKASGLDDMDKRLQRICDLNALSSQLEAELSTVLRKYAEEKEKNNEMLAQIAAVDIASRESQYFKQQVALAEAQEKLRLEMSRAQILQQSGGLQQAAGLQQFGVLQQMGGSKEQSPARGGLAGGSAPATPKGPLMRLPPVPLTGGGKRSFGAVNLHRLGSDGADYLKNQLEAAGIVTAADDDERDSPSSEDRRSNLSNGDSGSVSTSSASIPLVSTSRGLGSLDSQVAYSQERRMQLMRQLQELSSPTGGGGRRAHSGYASYREAVPYAVSP